MNTAPAVNEFDEKGCYTYRKICAVTLPVLLSMLMEHIIGMTDTAFLGRVSEVALGASALGTVYFLAFFVLGAGFSFGAQILIARRNGQKDYSNIGPICYAGGFFLAVFSILLMFLLKYFSPVILPYMIRSEEICKATMEYLNWRIYGLFFAFISAMFRAFYVGIANTGILTYSSIAMVLVNILLNYALIFGKYGMPEMGIAGAALASSIAEAVSMICYIAYSLKFIDLKKYGFHTFSAFFNPSILQKVFSTSFWMMLQSFCSVSVWFFFFIAVERLGERSLAVINLARTLSTLPFIIIHAFATTTNSLVSNLIGENRSSQVWRLIRKFIFAAFLTVFPLLLLYALFPEYAVRIYTDNKELIQVSTNVVYVMCIAGFIQIGTFILFNAVSGTGAVKTTVFIECISLILYVIFVWLIIIRNRPTPAVAWSAEILYQASTALMCLLFLLSGKWKNKKI
ncbi:MAG: MATE family efflux transporter [Lentisphaeria bacterium]|nr:MATE family efflux transporter [Lentisphaeria bacterium]